MGCKSLREKKPSQFLLGKEHMLPCKKTEITMWKYLLIREPLMTRGGSGKIDLQVGQGKKTHQSVGQEKKNSLPENPLDH